MMGFFRYLLDEIYYFLVFKFHYVMVVVSSVLIGLIVGYSLTFQPAPSLSPLAYSYSKVKESFVRSVYEKEGIEGVIKEYYNYYGYLPTKTFLKKEFDKLPRELRNQMKADLRRYLATGNIDR